MTPIDTTAVNATVTPSLLPLSAGRVRISANTATAMTALKGMRLALMRRHRFDPGTAPSRLNAYIIREALVMQLMPQKNCPTTQMIRIIFVHCVDMALSKTANTVPPPSLTALVSDAAKVMASRTIQPAIAE